MNETLETPSGPLDADDTNMQIDNLHVRPVERLFSRHQRLVTSGTRSDVADSARRRCGEPTFRE